MRRMCLGLLMTAALLLGCGGDDSSGPSTPEVEGAWSGTVNPGGTLVLNLSETNGNVSGNGTLTAPGFGVNISASGTYVRSTASASLTITSPGFEPMNLNATVTDTRMVGSLNGSGFNNAAISLDRQ